MCRSKQFWSRSDADPNCLTLILICCSKKKLTTVDSLYLEFGCLEFCELEASIKIKNTFSLLSPTTIWHWRLFYKSKLPEAQNNLHFE